MTQGNMFQLDEENWKTFTRWKEEYGTPQNRVRILIEV